ncbi:MAG: hypothetical protein AAFX99_22475, partial [Myxococcota bacterium]
MIICYVNKESEDMRMLFIEDHATFARLVCEWWLGGFEVVHVLSLKQAEVAWAEQQPQPASL